MCNDSYEILPIPLNDPSITPAMRLLATGQQWQPCDARTNRNIYRAEIGMKVRLWLEPWTLQLRSLPEDGLYTYVDSTVHCSQKLKLFRAGDSSFLLVRQLPSCCIEIVSTTVFDIVAAQEFCVLDLIADFGQNIACKVSVNISNSSTVGEAESTIRQVVAARAGFGISTDKSRFIIETFRGAKQTSLVIPFLLGRLKFKRILPSKASNPKAVVKKRARKKPATSIK